MLGERKTPWLNYYLKVEFDGLLLTVAAGVKLLLEIERVGKGKKGNKRGRLGVRVGRKRVDRLFWNEGVNGMDSSVRRCPCPFFLFWLFKELSFFLSLSLLFFLSFLDFPIRVVSATDASVVRLPRRRASLTPAYPWSTQHQNPTWPSGPRLSPSHRSPLGALAWRLP